MSSGFNRAREKHYMAALEKDFEHTTPDSQAAFLKELKSCTGIQIAASPQVATSIALVDGKPHVFLANFAGLRGGVNPVQTVQTGVRVTVPSEAKSPAYFLPFMGEVQKVEGVRVKACRLTRCRRFRRVRCSGTSPVRILRNNRIALIRISSTGH